MDCLKASKIKPRQGNAVPLQPYLQLERVIYDSLHGEPFFEIERSF
jgi:hypothetical protein